VACAGACVSWLSVSWLSGRWDAALADCGRRRCGRDSSLSPAAPDDSAAGSACCCRLCALSAEAGRVKLPTLWACCRVALRRSTSRCPPRSTPATPHHTPPHHAPPNTQRAPRPPRRLGSCGVLGSAVAAAASRPSHAPHRGEIPNTSTAAPSTPAEGWGAGRPSRTHQADHGGRAWQVRSPGALELR
jgi:hypothetical protein